MALWAFHNCVDLSTVLPTSPVAVFVRRHHGTERDRVLLFSGHICTLDQIAYSYSTFESTLRRAEAVIAVMAALSPLTSQSGMALDDIVRATAPGSEPGSKLRQRFSIQGSERQVLTKVASADGRLGQFKELRAEELRRGLAFRADQLSYVTLEYAAHHLLDSGDSNWSLP